MPTHQFVRRSVSDTPISLSHASLTSIEAPFPKLCCQAVNTLNELTLGDAPHHQAFRQWILGYGLTFVAHAIAFERAAEVVSGARTRESFLESLQGFSTPATAHSWKSFAFSALSSQIYVPPCAMPQTKGASDALLPLLNDDLGNCVLEIPPRPSTQALQTFLRRAQTLDSLLTPRVLQMGFDFVTKGWERVVVEYVESLQRAHSGFILGGRHLIDYYEDVIMSCKARARARLSPYL
jgi:hypothetical protein